MRELTLVGISVKGFKSFRNDTDIEFPDSAGLRFITGDNRIEPSLGPNGAGKSAMWDALVFCLYNMTSKRSKASDVVSWGSKQIDVATYWNSEVNGNGEIICIQRKSSPNKLTINDEPADQKDVDKLLGANYGCFLQSVVFGQGNDTFYDLNNNARGELLDEVLDIKLWLDAAELAGTRCKILEKNIQKHEKTIASLDGALNALEPESTFTDLIDAWEKDIATRFDAAVAVVERVENELSTEQAHYDELQRQYNTACSTVDDQLKKIEKEKAATQQKINDCLAQIGALDSNIVRLHRELKSYTTDGKCPACGQYLQADNRKDLFTKANKEIKDLQRKRDGLQLMVNNLHTEQNKTTMEWTRLNRVKLTAEEPMLTQKFKIAAMNRELAAAVEAAEKLSEFTENPHKAALRANQTKRAQLETDLALVISDKQHEQNQYELHDYWRQGFKRLRLWLMKRVLSVMELEVSAAASTLGLPGWEIKITTEVALKSGDMKPGIHIQISSPHAKGPWAEQSGGEEQRVRLAVAMGFSAVIQRMAGVWNRLEVWDEPSNWLSEQGVEDLLQCLAYRAETTNKTIWVIDHRSLSGNFAEVWSVIKDTNGSHIKVIAGEG